MKLVISTQYMENYAEHAPEADCDIIVPACWKYKGGSEYIVDNYQLKDVDAIRRDVERVAKYIEYDNPASREYVLDWSLEDDNFVPFYEKSQLEYPDSSFYWEPRLDLSTMTLTERFYAKGRNWTTVFNLYHGGDKELVTKSDAPARHPRETRRAA